MRSVKRGSPHTGSDVLTFNAGQGDKVYRTILNAAPDAIILVNGQGRIVLHNTATEEMFGYTAAELEELTVEDLLPQSLASLHRAHRKSYTHGPAVRPMGSGLDLRGRRKDGREIHMDIMLSPFRDGPDSFVVAVIRDDTVKQREREAIDKLVRSLQEERARVQRLKSLLPICAWCKKIRDDSGYWTRLEEYFHDHADVDFTHGICPDCARKVEEQRHGTTAGTRDSRKKPARD